MWANKFKEQITLINKPKNDNLQKLVGTSKHKNYDTYNNSVLDPIVSIKQIPYTQYPKAYDVSIPETGNFTTYYYLQGWPIHQKMDI